MAAVDDFGMSQTGSQGSRERTVFANGCSFVYSTLSTTSVRQRRAAARTAAASLYPQSLTSARTRASTRFESQGPQASVGRSSSTMRMEAGRTSTTPGGGAR